MSNAAQNHAEVMSALTRIENLLTAQSGKTPKTSADAVLREKLKGITLKRHAVLTGTLGGLGYEEMAKLMKCDVTTVKLHLKACLNTLAISTRSALLAQHIHMLDSIPDKEYEMQYGISKRWWLEQKPEVMKVIAATKPTANQHTKKETK